MQIIRQVLVIEDNLPERKKFRSFLDAAGLPSPGYTEIHRLPQVMELPVTYQPDIIFLHASFSGIPVLESLAIICKWRLDAPVIVLCNLEDPGLNSQLLRAGAQECLLWPGTDQAEFNQKLISSIERKKYGKSFRDLEQTSKHIMNSALDAIVFMDIQGKVTYWTPQAVKIFGWTESEALGATVAELIIPPEYREMHRQGLKRYIETGKANVLNRVIEISAIDKAGRKFPVELAIVPIVEGDQQSFCAFIRDITEKSRSRDAIRESEERLRHISQATNDAIWDHNLVTGEIWWNEKLYELYGRDPKDGPAGFETWQEKIHPEDRERVVNSLMESQQRGETYWQNEYRFLLPNGQYAFMYDRNFYTYREGRLIRKSGSNLDITALKKAEDTLINNELKFRTLTSNAPVGIFQTDTAGNTIYVNETWLEFTGFSNDEVHGMGWINAIHPEDRADVVSEWGQRSSHESPSARDYRLIDKKGNVHWVSGNAVPFYDKDGKFAGYIGTLADISERKRSEEALKESEEKYRTLVEQSGDAIAIFDLEGKILDVNFGATQLLQYSKEELRELTLVDILTPEELVNNPVRFDLLQSGASTIRQRKMHRKDGSIVETEVHAKRLTNGNFLASIRDLTERIKTQQLIEKQRMLAEKLIESLPGVFYLFDDQGKYIRWNKLKEKISGYGAAEIAKMSPVDFFEEGPDRDKIKAQIIEGFVKGETVAEAPLFTKDGRKIPFYFTGVTMEYEGRACLLGMGIDISDRKKAEDMLRQTTDQLRELSAHLQNIREEERIGIAREIHDELGQQLTVLKMDIAWLKRKIVTTDPKVERKMDDLMAVIDGTVKTVRRISSDLRPSMLDDLGLVSSLEWHSQEFEKRSGIRTHFTSSVEHLDLPADTTTAMYRIFQESLTNVARHSDAQTVNASLRMVNGRLQMEISDDGRGFSVNGIENKKTLGILGMRERVFIMNGEYAIDSMPGKGTTVMITIPIESFKNSNGNP